MSTKRLILPHDLTSASHHSGKKGTFHLLQYVQATTQENFDSFLTNSAIVFILSGIKNIRTSHSEYEIHPGELFMIPRGEYVMSEYISGIKDFQSIMLFFNSKVARSILNNLSEYISDINRKKLPVCQDIIKIKPEKQDISILFHTLHSYCHSQYKYQYELISLKFNELIYLLLDSPHQGMILHFLLNAIDDEKPDLNVIMEKHLYTPVTVDELALLAGRSLSQFKREFQVLFGQAPHTWIIEKRLARTAFLLQTTTQSMDQIAEECGFVSTPHFSRLFKKRYHLPPSEYRANQTK